MTAEQLEQMSQCSIEDIPKNSLVNIREVSIASGLSGSRRMLQYLEQIQNPYCFLWGTVPVQISFTNKERELSEALIEYFRTLKR